MFFIVSKIASYFLSPLFWVLLLIVLAFLFRKRKAGPWILLAAMLLFYFFSNRFLVDEVVRAWESPITEHSALASSYDAAIVLGGGVLTYDKPSDRMIFREAADKLLQTIDLYKNGRIKYIMLSGGPGELFVRDKYEAALMGKYLVAIGIPDSVIMVDSLSDNTHENALNSSVILKDRFPDGKFLLITTALHMRRAEGCCRKAGLNVTPYATGKLTGTHRFDIEHLLIPQTESFLYWRNLLHEVVGLWVYRLKGYM